MKRLFLLVTVLALLASCQKEVGFESSTGGGGGTGGGGTGGGGGTTTDTYQPVTRGSFWKYKDSALGGYITTMTCTGQQKTIDNRVFDVFNSETTGQPSFEGYFYVKKPEYGMRAPVGGVGTLDYIYLNETAAVGHTWTNSMGTIGQFPARFTGTIIEKNISKTVAGKSFTNVMHTNLVLEYEVPFYGWTEVGNYEYFIAKNIGIIRIESDLGFPGATTRTVLDLIDYSIK